jgi:hypothetical protein
MYLWFRATGWHAVWAEASSNGGAVRAGEADLRERRILLGVTVGCALVGAAAIYWLLWRRDFWGWRTVGERRSRIVPVPPLTSADLLPAESGYTMRLVVDYGRADTSRFFDHADQLAAAEIVARHEHRLRLTYQGHTFELGWCEDTGSMCLFVEDADCPDERLLEVANHFNGVATLVEYYQQHAPLTPLWNMLIVAAVLGVIAGLIVLFAD